eukprot:4293588-Pleurochrysis_carterae.AAC.1
MRGISWICGWETGPFRPRSRSLSGAVYCKILDRTVRSPWHMLGNRCPPRAVFLEKLFETLFLICGPDILKWHGTYKLVTVRRDIRIYARRSKNAHCNARYYCGKHGGGTAVGEYLSHAVLKMILPPLSALLHSASSHYRGHLRPAATDALHCMHQSHVFIDLPATAEMIPGSMAVVTSLPERTEALMRLVLAFCGRPLFTSDRGCRMAGKGLGRQHSLQRQSRWPAMRF